MSIDSTEGLEFQLTDRPTQEEFTGHFQHLLTRDCESTEPLELGEGTLVSHDEYHPLRSFVGAVVTAVGIGWCGESSAPIPSVWNSIARRLQEDEPVADFFEPVTFNWNEDIHIARMAARRYSEQTHADY